MLKFERPSKETTRKLRMVLKKIRPEKFDMRYWLSNKRGKILESSSRLAETNLNATEAPLCNTVGCLAGWTCATFGSTGWWSIRTAASNILGLSYAQEQVLFYVSGWPQPFRDVYWATTTPEARLKALKDRVNHFIKTGE